MPFYVLNFANKQLLITDVAIFAEDGLFWPSIVTFQQLICDIMQTWVTGIMMSYSLIILGCVNWHKNDLH